MCVFETYKKFSRGNIMIRFIFFIIYALFVIILTPFLFLFFKIAYKNKIEKRDIFVKNFVSWVFKCANFIAGAKITAIGCENIPDEPVLFVGNHKGIFDILISYIYFKTPTGFIAKKEIQRIPLLNVWMDYVHCLFMDRQDTKEALKTILAGIENVKNGYSMVIFPEGTRSKTDELLPFKEGSLKIAEKSKCRIVPMAITNTNAIFEDHRPFFKKSNVTIEFGKPFYISDLEGDDKKFAASYTRRVILKMYEKNLKR